MKSMETLPPTKDMREMTDMNDIRILSEQIVKAAERLSVLAKKGGLSAEEIEEQKALLKEGADLYTKRLRIQARYLLSD